MSDRYPGGIITKSPATPTGPYENGTAPGIWSLEQQMQYQQQGIWPTAGLQPSYIEDVFSTWLYQGTGATQTITNGIDLSGKGGLVWTKIRSNVDNHILEDTVRGAGKSLSSNYPYPQNTNSFTLQSFLTNGYTVAQDSSTGASGENYVSWTWRNQPKFFQCLTYTGTGTGSSQTISHNLGSVPGCMIVKSTAFVSSPNNNWQVYHRSLPTPSSDLLILNDTSANSTGSSAWNSTNPTSTTFSVSGTANASGIVYVAYLFAHNAGGFGLTGTDNVISCGRLTNGGAATTVNLGYEVQWLLTKEVSSSGFNWNINDIMRGDSVTGAQYLNPNTSGAETTDNTYFAYPTATGFGVTANFSSDIIYIAIRRGPMKVPTLGTSVFTPVSQASAGTVTTGFPVDLAITGAQNSTGSKSALDRLRGDSTNSYVVLFTNNSNAEGAGAGAGLGFDNNTGYVDAWWNVGTTVVYWNFRRAPSFFDEVCYTGTGPTYPATQAVNHNLGVVPELTIVKRRTSSATDWGVDFPANATYRNLVLNNTSAGIANDWFGTPSSTQIQVSGVGQTGASGSTYVAYLFATCAGVSKVGSYTGTGATQTISCGFTGGARFVLIKRADSTGDWYVWDTARGMVSGTDPNLQLNNTNAETNTNSIYTATGGFQIVSTAAGINASGGTYIFLSIA